MKREIYYLALHWLTIQNQRNKKSFSKSQSKADIKREEDKAVNYFCIVALRYMRKYNIAVDEVFETLERQTIDTMYRILRMRPKAFKKKLYSNKFFFINGIVYAIK